ncbi:dethiobiotin synthase, partial [Klebsiella pneumoniae]|nr:dethiobiotin synthase [Klebsiella pneumoniae]
IQPPGKRHAEYLATLNDRLAAPLLGEIPWLADASRREDLGQYLDLSALDRASSTVPAAVHPAG